MFSQSLRDAWHPGVLHARHAEHRVGHTNARLSRWAFAGWPASKKTKSHLNSPWHSVNSPLPSFRLTEALHGHEKHIGDDRITCECSTVEPMQPHCHLEIQKKSVQKTNLIKIIKIQDAFKMEKNDMKTSPWIIRCYDAQWNGMVEWHAMRERFVRYVLRDHGSLRYKISTPPQWSRSWSRRRWSPACSS